MMSSNKTVVAVTHAFIDTNILIRIATQGRPGCERQHFDDLRTLVENRTIMLLRPEVVHLEVEKAFRSLARDLESDCDKLADAIGKALNGTWNEIDSLKSGMLGQISEFKRDKIAECIETANVILEFLRSDAITRIPLTPDTLVNAKRRQIAGTLPNCKKSSDQDALIVESLSSCFLNTENRSATMFFCTENTSDFALEVKSQELNRRFVLDPSIQAALPPAHFSTDLSSMLAFA